MEQLFLQSQSRGGLTEEELEVQVDEYGQLVNWSMDVPRLNEEHYLWTRQRVWYTYTPDTEDGTTAIVSYTDPYCLSSAIEDAARGDFDAILFDINGVKESISNTESDVKQLFKDQGKYVAVSDFGKYLAQLNTEIKADPSGITQYYSFVEEIQTNLEGLISEYKKESDGYIRSGLVLDSDLEEYIVGVVIGQNLTTTKNANGEEIIAEQGFRCTLTARKLSFWQDSTEVAYVSGNQLYIKQVVALQAVTIGEWKITDSNGLTFKWIGQ